MKYIIVGSGNISSTYVKALGNLASCELVGNVSRSGVPLPAAKNLPSWHTMGDVTADYNAVILATPNGLHPQGAMEAAALGKHVLTEKPLGITREGVAKMIRACQAADVTLAVCYQRRTSPDNQAVKKLIEGNTLGRIFAADLSAKFYRDQAYYDSGDYRGNYALDGGGPFMQQACHNIDIYAWFFGLPKTVHSVLGQFMHNMEAEDHGAALLHYASGMIGTVIASTATRPGFAAQLEIHCEKGSLRLTDDVISFWDIDGIANPSNPQFDYVHDGSKSAAVTDTSAHERIIKDFERAVLTGRTPLGDAHSAQMTTELILKIYQANCG